MKKIVLFTLALTFAVTSLNAQNRWFFDGSVGVGYTKVKDSKADYQIRIMPSVNYMFNDNWAVGLGLGYTYTRATDQSVITVAPRLTYFMKLSDKFYYTPDFSIAYARNIDAKTNAFGVGFAPLSFEFRPTNCIGITFAAGELSFMSSKRIDNTNTSDLNFNLNEGVTVGLRFYF